MTRHIVPHIGCLLLAFVLTACGMLAPARLPEQFDNTPGPPVTLTENRYESEVFTVDYPRGWNVITSPAFSSPWVIFVSPDETALIIVATDRTDTEISLVASDANDDELRREVRELTEGDARVFVGLVTWLSVWNDYQSHWDRVIDTLQIHH